jgi:hypothetical protein
MAGVNLLLIRGIRDGANDNHGTKFVEGVTANHDYWSIPTLLFRTFRWFEVSHEQFTA